MNLTVKDIATVVVTSTNIHTGAEVKPVYEAYGYERFQGFVTWHQENARPDWITKVEGFGYDWKAEGGTKSYLLASEFIGVKVPALI